MHFLMYLFRQAKGLIVAALLSGIVSGLSSAALLGLIGQQLTQQAAITPLILALLAGLILLVMVTDILAKWLLTRLGTSVTYTLQLALAKRILNTPLRQLELIGNPTLKGALVEDIRTITVTLNQLPNVCIGLTIILSCSLYLIWLSPLLFTILILLALPTLMLHRQLSRRSRAAIKQFLTLRDQRDEHFSALTEGAKELQLNRQRRLAFVTRLLEPTLTMIQQQVATYRFYHILAQSWSQSAYFVFILSILLLAHLIGLDLTVLTSYAVTALYMKNSVNQLLSAIPQWTEATLAFQKIEQLQLSPLEETIEEVGEGDFPLQQHLHLALSAIKHAYTTDLSDEPFTLGPIDLHFSAGELIFLAGANGSGKTTLMKILAGLYMPESGGITLNGVAVTAQNQQRYRGHFSVIFSDFYLFSQLLGMEEAALDERALAYLQKLQLETKVNVSQGHLSTLDLSQGQRKRLALLTAYLEDRPIYLFDEWAANQDPAFKELFYRELLPELAARGKLVIAITHDEQYFPLADRLLRLANGTLLEEIHSPAY